MYGLLHCLPSLKAISTMIASAMRQTRQGGYHLVATFNEGHMTYPPTLDWYQPSRLMTSIFANTDS